MADVAVTEAGAPVLAYAQQQKRWERNVYWLLVIVGVYQLLLVLTAVTGWAQRLTRLGAAPWVPAGWAMPPRTAAEEFLIQVEVVLGLGALPMASLTIAAAALLTALGSRRLRKVVVVAGIVYLVLRLAMAVVPPLLEMVRQAYGWWFDSYHSYGEGTITPLPARPWSIWLAALESYVAEAYPVGLLLMVLNRAKEPSPQRGHVSASIIWWLTVWACMLYAVPTVITWLVAPWTMTMRTSVTVFGAFNQYGVLTSLLGVGELCRAAACFSVFFLVVYTRRQGARGRAALLICAALLFVYVLSPGVTLLEAMPTSFSAMRWSWGRRIDVLNQLASLLTAVATAAAFPLAIRQALTLSAVRERLDGAAAAGGPS